MRTGDKRSRHSSGWSRAFGPGGWLFSPALRRIRRQAAAQDGISRDEGFSIIEVTVAFGVFAIVATFMSHMLTGGMSGVLLGKRREIATQEANRALEIARSLSYDAIGLIQSDPTIATDGEIEDNGGTPSYRAETELEPIVWATGSAADHPFNPHIEEVKRGSTELTRYVYVTGVNSDEDDAIDLKRISVRVTWSKSGTGGPKNEVRAQTLVNASGLVVTGPGSGGSSPPPGSPPPGGTTGLTPLTANTNANAGSLNVRSDRGLVAGLVNAVLPSGPASYQLPTSSGETKFRAVSDVMCSGTSAKLSGLTETYGGHPVGATVDDNPATNVPSDAPVDSYTGIPPDQINGLDDIDNLLVETLITSAVSCQATTNDDDGVAPTDDNLPYEKGTGSALGALNLVEDLSGLGLPSNTLTAVGISTSPISQEIDHQTVAGQREVYARSAAAQGLIQVLKVPGVFPEGLVRIDALDYSATVRAAAGTPSAAPTVTSPTINLRIFDIGNEVSGCASRNSNYCIMSINPGAAGFSGVSIDFGHNVLQNLGLTNLVYEVHVDILPPAKSPLAGVVGPNGEVRWSAEYSPIVISSRLRSNLTIPLVGSVTLTDTEVALNLGSVKVEACAGPTCI